VKFYRYGFPPLWLEFLIEESLRLAGAGSWSQPCPRSERHILCGLAHAAGAWLVIGNIEHSPESIRNDVSVISDADYLKHLARD
jgi:uncharacterized protein